VALIFKLIQNAWNMWRLRRSFTDEANNVLPIRLNVAADHVIYDTGTSLNKKGQ